MEGSCACMCRCQDCCIRVCSLACEHISAYNITMVTHIQTLMHVYTSMSGPKAPISSNSTRLWDRLLPGALVQICLKKGRSSTSWQCTVSSLLHESSGLHTSAKLLRLSKVMCAFEGMLLQSKPADEKKFLIACTLAAFTSPKSFA